MTSHGGSLPAVHALISRIVRLIITIIMIYSVVYDFEVDVKVEK